MSATLHLRQMTKAAGRHVGREKEAMRRNRSMQGSGRKISVQGAIGPRGHLAAIVSRPEAVIHVGGGDLIYLIIGNFTSSRRNEYEAVFWNRVGALPTLLK